MEEMGKLGEVGRLRLHLNSLGILWSTYKVYYYQNIIDKIKKKTTDIEIET